MRKVSIILIVLGILVVIASNLFIGSMDDDEVVRPPPVRDNSTLRSTTSGDVVGFRDKLGARAWQGIPFAAAPVKDQRWKAPKPPVKQTEVFEALAPGNMCPQFSSLLSGNSEQTPGSIVGDEDCLSLSIWSPPNAVDLPVMLWIHGGGNTIGHGGSYNGSVLATQREVVLVSINYRLGVFGWFNHPALHTGDPLDDSGNYGTLDIIRALEWVQNNIVEFGGDANNVTIFGESAGAFDTLAMMASAPAKGLFHKAIVQSGGFSPTPLDHAQNYQTESGHAFSSREIVAKLLVADGTAPSHEAAVDYQATLSPIRLREYLYNKKPEEFFAIFDGGGFGMINVPDNFGDGHVLPVLSTAEIFSDVNNHNAVPVILGTNRDEPALFMVRNPQYLDNFLGFLPRLKDPAGYKRIVKYGALAWKERGVDSLAEYMTAAGNADVFAYRFDWDEEPSQAGFDLSEALGAAHGLEIAFAFGDFDGGMNLSYLYPHDEGQQALANSMTSYWSEFAHSGSPRTGRDGSEVEWLRWGTNDKHSLILDTPADQGIFMDSGIVTINSIKAQLVAETGFNDDAEQCTLYVRTFREAFDETEYRALNRTCASLPRESISRF
jgi:para-nitrobenzyl esterase